MWQPPAPPQTTRLRGAAEAFLVLRRNPLELWGAAAYRELALGGRFFGRQQVMLNAPEAVQHVLLDNAANYQRTQATRRVLRPLLGDGVFLAEGDAWRAQRRTLAPAFAPRTLQMLAPHVVRAAESLEAELSARTYRPIDLLPALQRLALEIAGQSMFSLQMQDFGARLRAMLGEYGTGLALPGIADLLLAEEARGGWDGGRAAARAAFRARWTALLDEIIAARASPPEAAVRASADTEATASSADLLDMLRQARDPQTGDAITHAVLRDEVSTLLLAGHETTATTLFWALFLAAGAPDWQARIAAEAQALDLGATSASAALEHLPLARAHIEETLRLYPPAFLIVREAVAADTALAAITRQDVPAGTTVIISPFVLHRHHRFWQSPAHFMPERFLPGAARPGRFTYLPFGAGPRICIGAQFAMTEAVLVLARLLARFRVSRAGPAVIRPRGMVTTQPDRIARFELAPRRQ